MITSPLTYFKPLSLNDRLTIDVVTERFEGVECPWVVIEDETTVTLRCAPTIRMSPARFQTLKEQQEATR